jgi:hypothetical protein
MLPPIFRTLEKAGQMLNPCGVTYGWTIFNESSWYWPRKYLEIESRLGGPFVGISGK